MIIKHTKNFGIFELNQYAVEMYLYGDYVRNDDLTLNKPSV